MNHDDDPLYARIQDRAASAAENLPAGFSEELEGSFTQIMRESHRERRVHDEELLALIEVTKIKLNSQRSGAPIESRLPGGRLLHRAAKRVVARHIVHLSNQIQEILVAQEQLIETLAARLMIMEKREARLITDLTQHVIDRLTMLERVESELASIRDGMSTTDGSTTK